MGYSSPNAFKKIYSYYDPIPIGSMIDITTNRIADRINMPYLILVGCVESLPSYFSQFKIVKLQKLVALKVYDPSSHNSKE